MPVLCFGLFHFQVRGLWLQFFLFKDSVFHLGYTSSALWLQWRPRIDNIFQSHLLDLRTLQPLRCQPVVRLSLYHSGLMDITALLCCLFLLFKNNYLSSSLPFSESFSLCCNFVFILTFIVCTINDHIENFRSVICIIWRLTSLPLLITQPDR